MPPHRAEAISLYIHWPFCKAKCPYCDFNSHVREAIDERRWHEGFMRELAYWGERFPGRRLASIFFGGGTPSLMPPHLVAEMIDAARRQWPGGNDVEITLEANPTSVEAARMQAFCDAGVNRVSMGVQALDEAALAFLGREHSVAEALAAFEATAAILPRVSFDLIYARPGQRLEDWAAELAQALSFARGHLSLYQLTIEPATPFYTRHRRGDFALPPSEDAAEMFAHTQAACAAAGLMGYEVSNHAGAGQECRHNLAYWRGEDWVGIGPGAHGRFCEDGLRRSAVARRVPEQWLAQVAQQGHGIAEWADESAYDYGWEMLMMGLRLREGVALARLKARCGLALDALVDAAALARLRDEGLVHHTPQRLAVTPRGMAVLNRVLYWLLPVTK